VLAERAVVAVERAPAATLSPGEAQVDPRPSLDLSREVKAVTAAVPAALCQAARAEAARRGENVDRLEQAGLAGAIGAEKETGAGARLPVERLEIAEVARCEVLKRIDSGPEVDRKLYRKL
jgi:hypothetical protein